MAEFDDFFKPYSGMDDAQPLTRLRDTEHVPDLRRYTVGDLRAWVCETSPPMPGVLPKGIIRTPAQLKAGVVGTDQLADGAVGTTQLADGSVTAPKIANAAVTKTKIAVDGPHYVGTAGEPAFQNSWANHAAGPGLSYTRVGALVVLSGIVTHAAAGMSSVIFTLPAGFRTTQTPRLRIGCISTWTGAGVHDVTRVDIEPNGDVRAVQATVTPSIAGFIDLSGVTFYAP